eukprot:6051710-Amphidinium_carterae.2
MGGGELALAPVALYRLYWAAPKTASKLGAGTLLVEHLRGKEGVPSAIPTLPAQAVELPASVRHQLWSNVLPQSLDLTQVLRVTRGPIANAAVLLQVH